MDQSLKLYRLLLMASAFFYLSWWFAVEALLPGSFNPFLSRLLVSAFFIFVLLGSYISKSVLARIDFWFSACYWIATIHYFYLFHENKADINWIVGAYVTVMAVCACFQSSKHLLQYCIFVLCLSLFLAFEDPFLLKTIFLPGIFTILIFSYLGLRSRLNLLASQEALKSKDEFISIASHELRTPLTSIKLQTQMTKRKLEKGDDDALDPARMKRFLDQVEKQTDRLTSLIENMLDISMISAGKLGIKKTKINFSLFLEGTVNSLSDLLAQAQCKTNFQIKPDLNINIDQFKMEQVIVNLMTNAMKYGKGKPISISLADSKREIILIIQDHGIGIAKENQERIFQRFERAISAKDISGMGLGLYICQQFVEAHGGSIRVESIVGQGSSFTVRLPL